jgi:hypothetical protein
VIPSREAVERGRERIAKLAEADGEIVFAGEVRAGAWDHRDDVARAIQAAGHGFDDPNESPSARRTGREGRSISHSYGGEGKNHVD